MMEKFITKKRKSSDGDHDAEETVNIGSTSKKKGKKTRLYCDSYLTIGFTWCGDQAQPLPECLVCKAKLSNESMVLSKLNRHFTAKHGHLSDKPRIYFERILAERKQQSQAFTKVFKVSTKAQEASYLVAEIIAKNSRPHTEAESIIFPACSAIVKTMLGDKAKEEIKKIPLSNNTICRRICDMSADIENTVITSVNKSKIFAMQVDESTDIGGKAQLLAFIRYVNNEKITEQFFCCKELTETTTGQNIFDTLNKYLKETKLSWKQCVGICTDGAPSMVGSIKGFVSLAKRENSDIITTHCFLHREVLVGKTLGSDLKEVLNKVVKMVNYIKSRPLKSRLFAKLCKEMGANYANLLLHTEVRWFSRGKALSRVYELKDEMLSFFSLEKQQEFCELLCDYNWVSKLAYLVDIFDHLNNVNSKMQGKNETLLTSTDKMKALREKLKLWSLRVANGNFDMLSHFSEMKNKEVVSLITQHLKSLEEKIEKYFPSLSTENYMWVRNPFLPLDSHVVLNLKEEEELIDIRNDGNFKLMHKQMPLGEFWIRVQKEYPCVGKKAIVLLLQFSTSYLCESGFSVLTNIKSKKRERLLIVEEEMRVALSNVPPDIKGICAKSQAQISH